MDRDILVALGLDGAIPLTPDPSPSRGEGRVMAQLDPRLAVGHRDLALEQPLALVRHRDGELPLFARLDRSQGQAARRHVQPRTVRVIRGREIVDELEEGHVGIGIGLRFLGGTHQIGPADHLEISAELAAVQKLARILPFRLAAVGDLLDGPAALAGPGKEELAAQLPRRRTGHALLENDAVEPAVRPHRSDWRGDNEDRREAYLPSGEW